MITNITIKNIKGYGDPAVSLDIEFKPKKLNLLVAPNGFGKTSLTTAFSSLKPKMLDVQETDKFQKSPMAQSSLSITIDGNTYTADKGHNDITKNIYPFVVRGKLKSGVVSKTFGGHSTTRSFLDIEKIKVRDVHPNCNVKYSVRSIRSGFGANGKILDDISDHFNNYAFTYKVVQCFSCFEKYNTKHRGSLIGDALNRINAIKGKTEDIVNQLNGDATFFAVLESEPYYQEAVGILDPDKHQTSLSHFCLFYQLLFLYKADSANLRSVNERRAYEEIKRNVESSLTSLNTTWKDISINETAKELIVTYPKADEISNGQRDILTFVVQLIAFKSLIPKNKSSLLIIDEIFDYLDDANMIAAQYYLSELIKRTPQEIYCVILTHVDPVHFRSYVFDGLLNIQTLANSLPVGSAAMKAFITFRENLNRTVTAQDQLYADMSHYFFHFDPNTIDISASLPGNVQNLRQLWGRDLNMHNYVIGECNNYLSGQATFDPYAICIGVRLRLEKIVYESINGAAEKTQFLQTNKTNDKMNYARNIGVSIPDSFYYLSAIHNDADHLKDPNKDKACIFKLTHPVIKHLIRSLFDYHDVPMGVDKIH